MCVFVCLCHINLQKTLHVKFKLEYSVVAVSNSLMMLPPPDPHSCDQGAFNRDDKLFHSAFLMNYCFSTCLRSSFSPTGPSLLNIPLLQLPLSRFISAVSLLLFTRWQSDVQYEDQFEVCHLSCSSACLSLSLAVACALSCCKSAAVSFFRPEQRVRK